MSIKLFNFHTHNKNEDYGIINLFPEESPDDSRMFSIGLHPWHYSDNFEEKIKLVEEKITCSNVVAVGETGFDPKFRKPINLQREIFLEHVRISEQYEKPLIIHCVKYYNELVSLKIKLKPTQAWIIHGFIGNIALIQSLFKHGFHFSISETILRIPLYANSLLYVISYDKLFLETDDKDFRIEDIYNYVSLKSGIRRSDLAQIMTYNLKNIGI